MSWSTSRGGPGAVVGPQVERDLLGTTQSSDPKIRPILSALAELAAAFATVYPGRQLMFETSGHADVTYGYFTVSAKTFPE